jgi:DNA-binding IclR family transcriptional regulator
MAMSDTAYRVQVLDRAFALLDVLAASEEALGSTELGVRVGLNKSTVHRLLAVLERSRFVERDFDTGRYRLGLKLVQLGSIALSRFDLHRRARSYVERLMQETGETAHLGVLRQNEIISLVNAESQRSVRTPSTVGRRSPLHCTSQGKAVAAFLPSAELDRLLRNYQFAGFTRHTLRTGQQFRIELAKVRSNGFAVDDEEFEEGLRCIGAPVRDHSGKVIAAISIAGPSFRVSPERMPGLIRSVLNVAADLSESLGFVSGEKERPHVVAARVVAGSVNGAGERTRRRT